MKPEGGFGGASFAPAAPVVTRAIIAMCVVIQIVAAFGGGTIGEAISRHAGLIPARVSGVLAAGPSDVPAVLTLVTSLFLHAGWLHLAVNMSFLLWVGRHVEAVAGPIRFAALYLLGGIAGGLLQLAVAPASLVAVVGASGAIAGVFAAYALLFARRRIATRRILGVAIPGEVSTALWYLATWVALQFLTALAFNTGGGGVAVWAHIGGFVVGLIAARPLARRFA